MGTFGGICFCDSLKKSKSKHWQATRESHQNHAAWDWNDPLLHVVNQNASRTSDHPDSNFIDGRVFDYFAPI
jgi:hypothetical protein